jgi:hypothetical protein
MSDYYDGPRTGITTLHGQPHAYQSLWTDQDGGVDTFVLQPIDNETFQLALEDWAIWKRWDAAFAAGQTTIETHPALPEDRARHNELKVILSPQLTFDTEKALRAQLRYLPDVDGAQRRQRWQAVAVQWILPDMLEVTPS